MKIEIYPSLLSADFGNLAGGVKMAEAAGADGLHLDIMDGHFVPNITFGPDVVKMARRVSKMPLNVHLMLTRPDLYIERFIEAGADAVSIHVEADCDVSAALRLIRSRGKRVGLTLNPRTSASALAPFAGLFDYALVMTVQPGYGGQAFMTDQFDKIEEIYKTFHTCVMVDGGISVSSAALCAARGASHFVAGNSLYGAADMTAELAKMRAAAETAFPE